jgi:hypothetical protein
VQHPDGSRDDGVDRFLGTLESSAGNLLPRLVAGDQLGQEQRGDVAFFLAIQHLRVPHTRTNLEEVFGKVAWKLLKVYHSIPGLLEKGLRDFEASGYDLQGVTAESIRFAESALCLEVDPAKSRGPRRARAFSGEYFSENELDGADFTEPECSIRYFG